MSEFENNNSIVPTPNEEQPITHSNVEENEATPKAPTTKIVKTVVEEYEKKTAGFWVRFFAYIIDVLVVGAIVGILVNPIFYLMDWSFDESVWYAPMAIISAVFYYGYFILMTKICQQTVGKMILGLKVVSLKEEKPNWLTVIFRELVGRFISNTVKILYIMIAFMPKNQSLHDLLSDTVVIHEKVYVKNQKTIEKEEIIEEDFDTNQTAIETI